MRDDLLDAQAALDWAVAQIPMFQNAFLEWNKDPYELRKEFDSESGEHLIAAYLRVPLPLTFNAWAGAMINSLRSALDLLGAALARRNGKKPSTDTHFPIFRSEMDMIDPLEGIERKKWLTKRQRAAIKSLKPYRGGDHTLWALHRMDVVRKHERLLSTQPDISGYRFSFVEPDRVTLTWGGGGYLGAPRSENKSILHRSKRDFTFNPAQGHATITSFITFNEIETLLPIVNQEVAPTIRRFAERVSERNRHFSTPLTAKSSLIRYRHRRFRRCEQLRTCFTSRLRISTYCIIGGLNNFQNSC